MKTSRISSVACKTTGKAASKTADFQSAQNADTVIDPAGRKIVLNGTDGGYVVWYLLTTSEAAADPNNRVLDPGDVDSHGVPATWRPYDPETFIEQWSRLAFRSPFIAVTRNDTSKPIYLKRGKSGEEFHAGDNGALFYYYYGANENLSPAQKRKAISNLYDFMNEPTPTKRDSWAISFTKTKLVKQYETIKALGFGNILSSNNWKEYGYKFELIPSPDASKPPKRIEGVLYDGKIVGNGSYRSPCPNGKGSVWRHGKYSDDGLTGNLLSDYDGYEAEVMEDWERGSLVSSQVVSGQDVPPEAFTPPPTATDADLITFETEAPLADPFAASDATAAPTPVGSPDAPADSSDQDDSSSKRGSGSDAKGSR